MRTPMPNGRSKPEIVTEYWNGYLYALTQPLVEAVEN